MPINIVSDSQVKRNQMQAAHADAINALDTLQAARDNYRTDVMTQTSQLDAELSKATNLQPTTSPITGNRMWVVKRD